MSHSPEQQAPQQSHFQFQMWDKYLNVLNGSWSLDPPASPDLAEEQPLSWSRQVHTLNQTWHVPSTLELPVPASFKGRLLFPFKKFILRVMQPAIDKIVAQQNEFHAKVVQTFNSLEAQRQFNARTVATLNGLVELTDAELQRLRAEVSQHLQRFQAQFDAFQAHLNRAQAQFDAFQAHLNSAQAQFDAFQAHLNSAQAQFDAFQAQFDTFQTHLNTVQAHINTLQSHLDNRLEQIEPRIDAFEMMVWTFDRRKEALEIEQVLFNQKLEQLFSILRKPATEVAQEEIASLPSPERQEDYEYFLFQNIHRGSERVVKNWLRGYVQYFEQGAPVIDIGCGRGEFLEILQEHQIEAYGIDPNQMMVRYCTEKGLRAQEADVFAHLETLSDNSLGGIFAAHIVEHLPPRALQRFLQLCFDKLQHHKYLVLETPNPRSLYMLSQIFYQDLSHEKPLDPNALYYLMKTVGFEEIHYECKNPYPQGVSQEQLLQKLDLAQITDGTIQKQIDILNRNIGQLNNFLYGYLNYAMVARKIKLF